MSNFNEGFFYQKAGILLLDLMPAGQYQPGLFDRGDDARSRQRMATMDRINRVMGRRTLRYAGEGITKPWDMRAGRCSPAYTTRWQDLLKV